MSAEVTEGIFCPSFKVLDLSITCYLLMRKYLPRTLQANPAASFGFGLR